MDKHRIDVVQDSKPQILCVDDEPVILDVLKATLSDDFDVLTAPSGEDGIDQLAAHPNVAVVLSDFKLPGISGLEFLEQAKVLAPDSVRALLSGQVDLEMMAEALNSQRIHRLVLKPWKNDYLRIQMLEALSNHAVLRERRYLETLSLTDPVTALGNHRHFQDRLRIEVQRALRHGRSGALLMIDIDNFKSINDQFGHPAGDAFLKAVAEKVEANLRDIDIVSRYGGEEFAAILPDTGMDGAKIAAERIRKAVESTIFQVKANESMTVTITVSIGIAAVPVHGLDSSTLIARADQALYKAKQQGRNQSVGA